MSKKHHQRLKELQRIRHQHATSVQQIPQASQEFDPEASADLSPAIQRFEMDNKTYAVIRRDLVFLTVLIIATTAILVGISWAMSNTSLEDSLLGWLRSMSL